MTNLEATAKELIETKKQLDEITQKYSDIRTKMHNELVNSGKQTIEVDGYRITKAKPYRMKIYSRDGVTNGLRRILDLSDEVIIDVLVASQNEVEVHGDIVVRKLQDSE